MSRLEREPNLKKSLQSERSSLLNNTDLRSQIMDVKYRYKQQLSPIEQQEDIFPPTEASYRINITLLNNIAATEHKLLFLNHRLDQIYSLKIFNSSFATQVLSDLDQEDKPYQITNWSMPTQLLFKKTVSPQIEEQTVNIILEASKQFKELKIQIESI